MKLIFVLFLCLLSGCSNKEEQKKKFRGNVAANYILLVVATESSFSAIAERLKLAQEYGMNVAGQLELKKSDFKTIDDFISKMRESKETDIELYMAVVDLYDTAVKVDSLKASPEGYSFLTYVAKVKTLKEDWDVKKNKVELLMKN
jgi:hypothetical protein